MYIYNPRSSNIYRSKDKRNRKAFVITQGSLYLVILLAVLWHIAKKISDVTFIKKISFCIRGKWYCELRLTSYIAMQHITDIAMHWTYWPSGTGQAGVAASLSHITGKHSGSHYNDLRSWDFVSMWDYFHLRICVIILHLHYFQSYLT